jgi:perosamine synthetase
MALSSLLIRNGAKARAPSTSDGSLPGFIDRSRRVALLGGTVTFADCLVTLGYLINASRLIRGPAIRAYEREFADTIGARYAYSFAAARVGLYGLLRAFGVGAGDEVLLQVPTHIVVANAIRYTGARPVYVDCRRDDYNIDLRQAEERVTARTKALLLQHTFGIPADIDGAMEFARRKNLALIEDCVHALGAKYRGRPVGSFGDAAIFSTEETKIITSTMGGMVVTSNADLASKLKSYQDSCLWPRRILLARYVAKFLLSYFFTQAHVHRYARPVYEWLGKRQPIPGATSEEEQKGGRPARYDQRLSNIQAGLALRQLRRLGANIAHRRSVAAVYADRLASLGVRVPRVDPQALPAFLRYPVWVADRATAEKQVSQIGVIGTWFTSVLEEAASPASGDYDPGLCPQAELAAKHLVNLPTHPRVSEYDRKVLVDAVVRAEHIARLAYSTAQQRDPVRSTQINQ